MAVGADQESRMTLNKARQVLEVFRAIDPEMPMGAAVSFLLIAGGDDLSVTELSKQGGFALSSASRYVQSLGEMDRHHRPGHDLVKDRVDPMERRKKILEVTPRGKRIISQLKAVLGG